MGKTLTSHCESATGQAEPPSKRKKADESAAEEGNSTSTPNKFLSSLEKKANTQEATGPKINDTLASHVTSIMRQKPEEESEKNLFQKILRPENCSGLSKITVNQVIWDRVSAEARTGDVKMQRVQNALVKGITNVALILGIGSETPGGIEASNFSVKIFPFFCAQKVKFTDSLFGDDVSKQIKDITDDNKVTHKLLDKNRSWHRPSHANRGSGRGRVGFRGSSFRGRGSTNRPF